MKENLCIFQTGQNLSVSQADVGLWQKAIRHRPHPLPNGAAADDTNGAEREKKIEREIKERGEVRKVRVRRDKMKEEELAFCSGVTNK